MPWVGMLGKSSKKFEPDAKNSQDPKTWDSTCSISRSQMPELTTRAV